MGYHPAVVGLVKRVGHWLLGALGAMVIGVGSAVGMGLWGWWFILGAAVVGAVLVGWAGAGD